MSLSHRKIIYIDCKNSGISGDLFLSAISLLSGNNTIFEKVMKLIESEFSHINILEARFKEVNRNSLYPRKLELKFEEPEHSIHINTMKEKILKITHKLGLSMEASEFASRFFEIIAEAEATVHKTPPGKVHLHEIGSIDTVIDICGIVAYLNEFGVFNGIPTEKILCSPIPVGGGNVKIAHGVVPVPAPATSVIIEKYHIPIIGGPIEKELCTPTGAALIGCLVEKCNLKFNRFIPPLVIEKKVMGTGNLTDQNFPNILCIYLGTNKHLFGNKQTINIRDEEVAVIETTVDDSTGEIIGHMMDLLLSNGALDVNFFHVQSKKNRPATMIKVLTSPEPQVIERITSLLIRNLGTLGVRYHFEHRKCLERKFIKKTTSLFGHTVTYNVKVANDFDNPDKVINFKIEYDDIANISKNLERPISEIKEILDQEMREELKKKRF
ncbi:MAG: nickel pincer cofactor biosynthesis protein LarC [Promethearchaeota archaeon]